jgi:DNA-binding MarR family transcriptional regulator
MAPIRWLDDEEARAWRTFLEMRRELDSVLEGQLTRDAGLSAADYALLVPLSEEPTAQLRARDLARVVGWEKSRLSHQVRRMEQRGLIHRLQCPTDGRGSFIRLTDAGRRAIEDAAPNHVDKVRAVFFDQLSRNDIRTLIRISERVLDRLSAERRLDPTCDSGEESCDEDA